jgi:predicted GIY-YIG superfamily endonuclease
MKESAKKKEAIVYVVYNHVNGKLYVGVTTQGVRQRMAEHFSHAMGKWDGNGSFHKAIRKYGRTAFECFEIARFDNAVDALKEEVRLVALWKPHYNSTRGGEYPPERTPAGKERHRRAMLGKKSRLGKLHSTETKQLLRAAALKQHGEGRVWKRPKGYGSKKVICINTGEIFNNAIDAADKYKLARTSVVMCCLRLSVLRAKLVFRYVGDEAGALDEDRELRRRRRGTVENRPIICLNDKKIYQTNRDVVTAYKISKNTVFRCCEEGESRKTVSGLSFCYLDEWQEKVE